MSFVYVLAIPSDVSLENRMLFETPDVKMLLDFTTGNIYCTDCVWELPPFVSDLPQEIQTLFTDMDGRRLSEISNDGYIQYLEQFIDTN